jgi:hypothetical protein
MNNPWRNFSDELPKDNQFVEINFTDSLGESEGYYRLKDDCVFCQYSERAILNRNGILSYKWRMVE